ncbi:MAG: hypothetical protein PVJ52_01830 [Candidatus Woesebacteria bacterium]|jgi:hypothetical protein
MENEKGLGKGSTDVVPCPNLFSQGTDIKGCLAKEVSKPLVSYANDTPVRHSRCPIIEHSNNSCEVPKKVADIIIQNGDPNSELE